MSRGWHLRKVIDIVKKVLLSILIPVFLLSLAACKKQVPNVEEKNKPIEKVDPIKEQIKTMTLDEKIGQMFIVGLDGYTIEIGRASCRERV